MPIFALTASVAKEELKGCLGRGGIENTHSTDVKPTNHVRASSVSISCPIAQLTHRHRRRLVPEFSALARVPVHKQ